MAQERGVVDGKRKMTQLKLSHFSFGIRQCPTLPGVQPWLLCVHWTPPWPHLAKYNVALTRSRPGRALPGVRKRAASVPLAARACSPSQVQCCTLAGHGAGKGAVDGKRKMTQLKLSHFSFGIRQCPTLPGRHQPSTIGAERLNFCVRYGNRWIPFAITTGMP